MERKPLSCDTQQGIAPAAQSLPTLTMGRVQIELLRFAPLGRNASGIASIIHLPRIAPRNLLLQSASRKKIRVPLRYKESFMACERAKESQPDSAITTFLRSRATDRKQLHFFCFVDIDIYAAYKLPTVLDWARTNQIQVSIEDQPDRSTTFLRFCSTGAKATRTFSELGTKTFSASVIKLVFFQLFSCVTLQERDLLRLRAGMQARLVQERF